MIDCVQSKDRLIASLKDGVSSGGDDVTVSSAELDDMRQELDLVRDELQQSRMTIENLRVEAQVGAVYSVNIEIFYCSHNGCLLSAVNCRLFVKIILYFRTRYHLLIFR